MSKVNVSKITDGASCLREIGKCLDNNLNTIENCLNDLNDCLNKLSSYNGKDASDKYVKIVGKTVNGDDIKKWFKKIWDVIVNGNISNFDFVSSENNIKLLLKKSDSLDEIALLLDKYIKNVEKELGSGAAQFVLFDPMRTRGDGLNQYLLKGYVSQKNYNQLLKLCGGDKEELDKLFEACSNYSKDNGCGAYSLLYALNNQKNLNISKEKFFGNYLMDKMGVEAWYKLMKRKANGDSCGPINDIGAKKIFDKEGISSQILKNYDSNTFDGSSNDRLLEHIKNGGKATIMVQKIDDDNYNFVDYANTFYSFDKNNVSRINSLQESYSKRDLAGYDTSLAKSRHYVTITAIDNKGNVSFVDSADLSFSNIRHTSYKNFVKHVVSKENNGTSSFYDGQGGCILFGTD